MTQCDVCQLEGLDDCENCYMVLCKDIVANIIKPYNYGWRYGEEFEQSEF